jgi:hypothetical protein
MSKAMELIRRIRMEGESGLGIDWQHTRDDIYEAHDAAETEAERVACLRMYFVLMDEVERQGIVYQGKLEEFRELRRQYYTMLLIKEALIGVTDGLVRPDRMAAITRREVAAGRMAGDDETHRIAVEGEMALAAPRREPRGVWARVASWFKG